MSPTTLTAKKASVTPRPLHKIRIIGGRSCLDFVNTVHDRFDPVREDYIASVSRYFSWSRRVGLLSRTEYAKLASLQLEEGFMSEIRKFREQLYAFLLDWIGGQAPIAPATLAFWLKRAWAGLRLDARSPNCLAWSKSAIDVHLPLKRIALDVLDMLQHGQRSRLRRCAARDRCGWVFYDKSKSGARRWCSMQTCGAVAKMRRYRDR
jgi:predicted RNA-binding Zn ribbon-like protein